MCGLHIKRNAVELQEHCDMCIVKSGATALGLAA